MIKNQNVEGIISDIKYQILIQNSGALQSFAGIREMLCWLCK